jgi:signal transduction histidine kinase
VFYHFIIEVSDVKDEKAFLSVAYGFCILFAATIWIDSLFLNGFHYYKWGIAAKAGPVHKFFGLVIFFVIVRVIFLFLGLDRVENLSTLRRKHNKWVKIAALIYCGGSFDILSNYGFSVFPVSTLFLGASIVIFGYAILRHSFLSVAVSTETSESKLRREAASAEMQRLGMSAAFPLVSQGEVLGYLLLGEKMSEESYSLEDLRLLRIVANQAALAYQRVRYLEMAVHGARTEMLGEIAGGFAHEIKTPLANISLPAELSIMDIDDVEKGQKRFEDILPELKVRLKDIMQQTFKASEKIEAIRQFSKPGQVHLAAVDLSTVLQNSLGLLDHLLRKSGTIIRTDFPGIMAPVRGDAKQLEIVFVNLIKNAAEAMSQHKSAGLAREIWLKGYEDGNWVVASVKDTGPGIKKTEFTHLFEAYFTTKGSGGTGMGLFLSRQVVKAHGGSIDVRSEEGKGTEFLIRLPKYISGTRAGVHEAA